MVLEPDLPSAAMTDVYSLRTSTLFRQYNLN